SMAVTLPVVLILIDWYKNQTDFQFSNLKPGRFLKYVPYFILSIVFGVVAFFSQQVGTDAVPVYSFLDRVFLAGYGVVFYIYKSVVPVNLSAIYLFPQKTNGLFPVQYYAAPIIILAIGFLIFRL